MILHDFCHGEEFFLPSARRIEGNVGSVGFSSVRKNKSVLLVTGDW